MFAAYFVIQPFSSLAPEPVLSGAHTWRSLIHHIRLMSLPITKKYMRETKGVPLQGGEEDKPFPGRRLHLEIGVLCLSLMLLNLS